MRIPLGVRLVTWLIVSQVFGWAQCDKWRILNEFGSKAMRDLKYDEAIGEYSKAVEAAQQYRCGPTPIVISMISVADIYHFRGHYSQSEQLFLKAKGLIEQVPVQVRARGTEGTLLNELADLYLDLARYNDAQQLARQALDIRRQFSLKNNPSVVSIVTLAEADLALGKTSDAEALLREEMAASKKGSEWVRGGLEMRLAGILASQGRQGEAEGMARSAVEDLEKALGKKHPEVARALIALAAIYRAGGKYDQAIPLCERAITMDSELFKSDHPGVARDLRELAHNYAGQKRYAEAEPLYQRALAMQLRVLPPDHPDSKKTQEAYADLLSALGRNDEAEKLRR